MKLDVLLTQIEQYLSQQQWMIAKELCQQFLSHFPTTARLYFLLGQALSQLGEIEDAIASYHHGLKYQPSQAIVHAELGALYQQNDGVTRAIAHYQQAVQLNPALGNTHYNLATLLHHQGAWVEAISHYQLSLKASTNNTDAYLKLGHLHSHRGHTTLAIACYEQAIQSSQEPQHAHNYLGQLLIKKKAYSEAIDIYQQALAQSDPQAYLLNNLGQAFLLNHQFGDAAIVCEQAIAIQPDYGIAHRNLGHLWMEKQNHAVALPYFKQAFDSAPDDVGISGDYINLLLDRGQFCEAIPILQSAIQAQQPWVTAYCDQLKDLSPDNEFDHVRFSCIHLLQALQANKQNIALQQLKIVYRAIGELLYQSNAFQKAEKIFRVLLLLYPNDVELYLKVGDCLIGQHRQDAAMAIYHFALRVSGYSAKTPYGLKILPFSLLRPIRQFIYTILNPDGHREPFHQTLTSRLNLSDPQINTLALPLREELTDPLLKIKGAAFEARMTETFKYSSLEVIQGIYQSSYTWSQHYGQLTPDIQVVYYDPLTPEEPGFEGRSTEAIRADPIPVVRQSTSTSSSCGGVTCTQCMVNLIEGYTPTQVTSGVFHCNAHTQREIPPFPTFVVTIPYGRAWVAPHKNSWQLCDEIAIITPDHYILGDLSRFYPWYLPGCQQHSMAKHSIFSRQDLPKIKHVDGSVAMLSSLSGNVYYHWMIDVLPRISLLQKSGIELSDIDWFVVNSIQHPFQRETLLKLGIPLEKVIESDRTPHLSANRLIVPSFPGHLDWVPAQTIEFLRQTFLSPPPQTNFRVTSTYPKRIYISRANAKYRHVLNEADVIRTLESYGFYNC